MRDPEPTSRKRKAPPPSKKRSRPPLPMREKLIKWKLEGCTVAVTPITEKILNRSRTFTVFSSISACVFPHKKAHEPPATRALVTDAQCRRAWRPLAAYRAAHKGFEPTFAEEAALALKLWADLAKDTFDAATLQSMEVKTVACDLALLLDRLFRGDDAARDVAAVQALGRAASLVIRRAALWGADDAREVLNLVAAVGTNPRASVDLLTRFAVALELATRRKKRPTGFKKHAFSSYTDDSPVEDSRP